MRLYKTRCPKCAEQGKDKHQDNLAVYDDGHSWCFSCGYYEPANPIKKLKQKDIIKPKLIFELPEDTILIQDIPNIIPNKVTLWIKKYFSSLNFPDCFWSESKKYLLFLINDENNLPYAYTARYFGDNLKHPKWITLGINSSTFNFTKPRQDILANTCVLVEDIISGIKVGHIQTTLTLFGAHVSLERLAKLKLLGYTNIIFWLDADKYNEKLRFAKEATLLGLQTKIIQTELDPKAYSYEKIHEFLITN